MRTVEITTVLSDQFVYLALVKSLLLAKMAHQASFVVPNTFTVTCTAKNIIADRLITEVFSHHCHGFQIVKTPITINPKHPSPVSFLRRAA